jgi:hypothetical protein
MEPFAPLPVRWASLLSLTALPSNHLLPHICRPQSTAYPLPAIRLSASHALTLLSRFSRCLPRGLERGFALFVIQTPSAFCVLCSVLCILHSVLFRPFRV